MSLLRQQICNFLVHEETPVDSILSGHTMEEVFGGIDSILAGSEPEAIIHTLGFVRDAALYRHPFHEAFQAHLGASTIWDRLQELLSAPNFGVRRNAIYTIGKLTHRNRAYLLIEAFPFFLERDPINLPRLLFELVWLTNEWNWDFLRRAAAATHDLQRWSLCSVIDDHGESNEVATQFLDILTPLRSDPHPRVAAEVLLRAERIKVKLQPKLSKPEWRKEVKRIAELKPGLTFESAAMQFMQAGIDYDFSEFDRFVSGTS
jgi:hypothetical protein